MCIYNICIYGTTITLVVGALQAWFLALCRDVFISNEQQRERMCIARTRLCRIGWTASVHEYRRARDEEEEEVEEKRSGGEERGGDRGGQDVPASFKNPAIFAGVPDAPSCALSLRSVERLSFCTFYSSFFFFSSLALLPLSCSLTLFTSDNS